ncbi:MAG: carboxymuconolactone decarboxylase family protein [Nocardioides sp.]
MFITPVPESESTDELADYYRTQRTAWGFLPNYAGAFSTRPDVAQAWNLLNGTIRDGMDRRRFELATIAAARALRSTYCTAAHSKFLREVCGDEESLRAIAADPSGAGLAAQDRAVYEFAAKVATDAASVVQADVDRLREHGLSDADVADVVFAASARSFFTRVLDGLGAHLDTETASALPRDLLDSMVVGRPVADRDEP